MFTTSILYKFDIQIWHTMYTNLTQYKIILYKFDINWHKFDPSRNKFDIIVLYCRSFHGQTPSIYHQRRDMMEWAEKLPNILATTGMRSLSRTRTDRACGQCSLSIIFSASYFLPPPIRSHGNAPRMTTLRMSGGASRWRATGGGTKATNFFLSWTIILISRKYNFDINLK